MSNVEKITFGMLINTVLLECTRILILLCRYVFGIILLLANIFFVCEHLLLSFLCNHIYFIHTNCV